MRKPKGTLALSAAKAPIPAEWDCLTPAEFAVCKSVRERLGAEAFEAVPLDTLVCFVRGSMHDQDWHASCIEHLTTTLAWRAEPAVATVIANLAAPAPAPPPRRADFEAAFQAGPVGRDRDGHAIILERLGGILAREFCTAWPVGAFMDQCIYNKEATRSLCRELSHSGGRRVYKVAIILDLTGLSMQHASRAFLGLLQSYITQFNNAYPEFMSAMYFINAPLVFNAVWALVRPMIDPEILAKVHVYGSEKQWGPAFERAGFSFDAPLCDSNVSWSREMARLAPGGRVPPPFVPEKERRMLRALCPHRRREAALYIAKMVRGRAQRKRYAELQRLRQALAALLRSAPQRARRHRRSARSTAGSAASSAKEAAGVAAAYTK